MPCRAPIAPTAVAVLFVALGACTAGGPPDESRAGGERTVASSLPIIGGTFDAGDDAVVELDIARSFCTGTLVAPRVVLTAAHCVSDAIEAGDTATGTVRFGNGEDPWIAEIRIADMAMHREYAPPSFLEWDVAAVRLEEDAPASIAPIELNLEPLEAPRDIGLSARTIGFGVTDGATQSGFGLKREVGLTVDEITFYHVGVGTQTHNICQGDSGGPTLVTFGGVERIVGVSSFGSDQCRSRSYQTRVDSMQDWLLQVIDAWSGPCQLDGACVTEGCRSIDPDCDECGFDRTCGTSCPAVDIDCPLGARAGEPCEDEFDCESRLCLEALDDPRLRYCSATCDPARPVDTCPPPFSTCADGPGGDSVCVYRGPTPGAQGASCDEDDDCRSDLCDAENDICVEECGGDLPECPEPYSCRDVGSTQACTVGDDGGGGGCGFTGQGPSGAALFVLLCVCPMLLRRARGRRAPSHERPPLR